MFIIGIVFGLGSQAIVSAPQGNSISLFFHIAAVIGFIAITCCVRYFTWNRYSPDIEFSEKGILLPRWNGSKAKRALPYHELKSLDIRGKKNKRFLVIGTRTKIYNHPLKTIIQNEDEIKQRFKQAIFHSPDGDKSWAALEESEKNASLLTQYKAPATTSLIAIIVALFISPRLPGYGGNYLDLIALGGNAPALVDLGQLDRLLTSNFLHAGALHLYFNSMALFIFGNILEKLLGWKKFLFVFLFSAVGAAIASWLVGGALVSVGASGGIFGLMGSLLLINFKMGFRLPAGFNLGKTPWIIMIVINGALPFLVPMIDWAAHLGGFAFGIVITWLLLRKHLAKLQSTREQLELWRKTSTNLAYACFALIGVFVFSFIVRASDIALGTVDNAQLATVITKHSNIPAAHANEFAWALVTDPNRSKETMEFAINLMQPVVDTIDSLKASERTAEHSQYLDTYAAALFLNGDYINALLNEYKAQNISSESYYASQISRFLESIKKKQGAWVRGSMQTTDYSIQNNEDGILLHRKDNRHPTRVTVQVRHAGKRKGYFECDFADNQSSLTMISKQTVFNLSRSVLTMDLAAIDDQRVDQERQSTCKQYAVDGDDDIKPKSVLESLY